MEIVFVLLLALALSFDTFAVAVSCGLYMPRITFVNALKISISLAFFQAVLPLLGWLSGNTLKPYINQYDHWIAFILLVLLGSKMIWESTKMKQEKAFNPLNPLVILWLSVATSLDALVVGFSIALVDVHLALTVITIGGVTLLAAMTGILIGKKASSVFGKKMEMAGGIILIAIAIKVLSSHLA